MAIVDRVDGGYLLDHELYLEQTYQSTVVGDLAISYKFQASYFDLNKPHLGDGQQAAVSDSTEYEPKKKRCRRRRHKRKSPFNHGEVEAREYHDEIKDRLFAVTLRLCQTLKGNKSLKPSKGNERLHDLKNAVFLQLSSDLGLHSNSISSVSPSKLNAGLSNPCSYSSMIKIDDSFYLLPPHSKAFSSDVSDLSALIKDCELFGKYNCIVLDPPWENKSVRRGHKYRSLPFDKIASIPLHKLCASECLVVIWVTNKQKIMKWVRNVLFPRWNICYLAQWHWVKVTTNGIPVFPWESLHKKPYETIFLGHYLCKNHQHSIKENVICSVPCMVHSHKPPLYEVIKNSLMEVANPRCLEMFARSLSPSWSSWGNEVVKLQNISYFCDGSS
ncbi:unnamed protein product [Clavelina lepadiformis]|uniref:Methyltransferase-like protein 4 n=1 Tax=Clavelina lepadiformis TaxID=159417 RepID=A0ABP0GFT6_CLALP